jgi:cysteine desulfurase
VTSGAELGQTVYLDYNATAPTDERVLEAMLPYYRGKYGNAASVQHVFGRVAADAVEVARTSVASLVGARSPQEIVFTSGATEANNLALLGYCTPASRPAHLVTVATEHQSILDTAAALEQRGVSVTYLPVNRYGEVDLDELETAIRPETCLVSVMAANNEIGTVAPLRAIGQVCAGAGVAFHCDATQLAGKASIDVETAGIQLLSLSAHKLYGPKGMGALYVRREWQRRLEPVFHGGGHERGLRSGTLNVPGCVGFGYAAELASSEMAAHVARAERLRAILLDELRCRVPELEVNGHPTQRLPNTASVRFPGADADAVQLATPEVAVSSGSACSQETPEPSHVLLAIGLDYDSAQECIRFSIGRPSSETDVRFAASRIGDTVRRLTLGRQEPLLLSAEEGV